MSSPRFIPFSRPSIDESAIAAVGEVLRSGWITTGPQCTEFERRMCDYTGCTGAAAVTSATAGMHLVLKALGIGPGDEVITPSMTWVSTPNLICLSGATPVFVDVDRHTLMTHRDLIESAITPRTKLIVPVHFAGSAADLDPIRALGRERGIPVVEDAAHALGTGYRGRRIGQTGTTVFSFHPIKNITTGEGGMVCSDDPGLLERVRCLKFHGLGVDAYDRSLQGRSPQAEVQEPGYKYNLTDIAATLGLHQLAHLDHFIQRRGELAARYRRQLADHHLITPLADPDYPVEHAWHLFIVRLNLEQSGMSRDEFMVRLKEQDIGTGLHFRAVHLQAHYVKSMPADPGSLPDTEWNSDRICSLPLFPDMSDADVDRVVSAIRLVLRQAGGSA